MFSQRNEEQVILEYFGDRKGRFLDVGAYDGVTFSNTRQLYLNGWDGVCVEPARGPYRKLLELYKKNVNVILLNRAISEHERKRVRFYEGVGGVDHAGALSTVKAEYIKKWVKVGLKVKITDVRELKYDTLFDKWGDDFDFINIDAEGVSLRLFQLLPINRCRKLKCICVEHDNKFTEIIQEGSIHGFKWFTITDENIILMKGKHV